MTTSPLPFPHSPSAQVGPVVPLPAGVRIDRFVIEQTLHQGAHGFAYRVRESGHQQPLVLLECFPRTLAIRQPDGAVRARQAGDAIALSVVCEAFVQDARALAAIDHPGVIKVFGVINANRTVYRLMPFVDGQTLEEQRLERAEPPTVGGLVRLYDKLLDALEALHRAGFVHGLVQPDQILMKADDNAPLLLGMDGVAIELGEVTMSPWAAPEQQQSLRFERINASADLYMLAATMCFAATGAAPPRAEERMAGAEWDPAPLLAAVPLGGGDAPAQREHLIQAVQTSLALAAAGRPQRADDVRHILHPDAGDSAFVATSGPVPLWVGAVPDRDSQWETLEGMSGPVPLREEAEAVTQFVLDPAPVAASAEPPPAEPVVARTAVRAPRPAEPAPIAAGRRADDTPAAPPLLPRWLMVGVGSVALVVAALAWWSQRATSSDLSLPPAASGDAAVTAAPAVEAAPAPQEAATPAPVLPRPSAAAPSPAPAAPPPPLAVTPAPAATPAAQADAAAAAPAAVSGAAPEAAAAAVPAPAAAQAAPPSTAAVPPAAPPAAAAAPTTAPVAPAPAVAAARPAPAKTSARPSARPAAKASTKTAATKAPAKATTRAADRSAAAARAASPESLCGNRTQFSYLYCMQEACARAGQRNNAQCNALRRTGDIR